MTKETSQYFGIIDTLSVMLDWTAIHSMRFTCILKHSLSSRESLFGKNSQYYQGRNIFLTKLQDYLVKPVGEGHHDVKYIKSCFQLMVI